MIDVTLKFAKQIFLHPLSLIKIVKTTHSFK